MFDNIGGKMKSLAVVLFVLGAIGSAISGFVMMSIDEDMIFFGLLTIIFGVLTSWIGTWMLYGFGELIEKTTEIAENTRGGAPRAGYAAPQTYAAPQGYAAQAYAAAIHCPNCGKELTEGTKFCPGCGKPL